MYLSSKERDSRFEKVRAAMEREIIDALIVVGTNNIGGATGTGGFRYLTDFFIIFYYGLLVFYREYPPVMLLCSELQKYWADKYSWIESTCASTDLPKDAVRVILDRNLGKGRIGVVGLESLPFKTFEEIKKNLHSAEFVDAEELLSSLRAVKSEEEISLLKTAAEINDEAFNHLCQHIQVGMREYEAIGIIEGFQRRNGIDKCFNLICSGKFRSMEEPFFPGFLWYPDRKEIQYGDSILFEITGGYGGYWNQLVRMINVGGRNQEAEKFCFVAREAIEAAREHMQPGARPVELVEAVEKCVNRYGLQSKPPIGHFVGLDLVEARISPNCQVELKEGMILIIHPHPSIPEEKGTRVSWGETYLISKKGAVRLNSASDDYRILNNS